MEYESTKIKPTSLRISPELKQHLDTIAKEEKRSFNNLVNIILAEYVENHMKDHPND